MPTENAYIDANSRNTLTALANDGSGEIYNVSINPITGALLVEGDLLSTNTSIGGTIPGGTAGSVLFLGLGSTLAQDNANFFYDDTQNFLGLGTNTPDATLHVVGSLEFDLGGDSTGDIYYRDASGFTVALPIGAPNTILTSVAGIPSWAANASAGYNLIQNVGVSVAQRSTINLTNLLTASDVGAKTQLTIDVVNLAADPTFTSSLDLSTIGGLLDLSTQVTGLLDVSNIDVVSLANDATFINALEPNLDLGNLGGLLDLSSQVTGTLLVTNGGTGATTLTGVLHGNGTSPFTAIPLTTNGAILIGDGSGEPTTLSAFTSSTGVLKLANGGTASNLSDPGANRLWGWDDTDNSIGFWTIGTGLSYDHASHTLSSNPAINILNVNQFDDFTSVNYLMTTASGGDSHIGKSGNFMSYTLTGGDLNWSNTDAFNELNHPGIIRLRANATGATLIGFTTSSATGSGDPLLPTGNSFDIKMLCRSTRTTGTQSFLIGLGGDVYIRFLSTTSASFLTFRDGTGSIVTTSVPVPVSGTWFIAQFVYTAGTNTLDVTVDGASVFSGTPTWGANNVCVEFSSITGNAGTFFDIDYVITNYSATRS